MTVAELAPDALPEAVLEAAGLPGAGHPALIVGLQPTLGLAAALALTGTALPWSIPKACVC